MKKSIFFILVVAFSIIISCTTKVDIEAEKASIKLILDQYATACKSLDIDQFSKIFSNDENLLIFDTYDRFNGWESWKERLVKSFKSIEDVEVTFRDYVINIDPAGKIAWLLSIEDAQFVMQGEPSNVEGMRVTWVLEKRDGNWIIVQGHWSVSEK